MYVDVHNHLAHESFDSDLEQVLDKAINANFYKIVINGLNPSSNRKILDIYKRYPNIVVPALGLYPVDVVGYRFSLVLPFKIERFNPYEEIDFIADQISTGEVKAIGECGMDGYWVGHETYDFQKEIFIKLIELAKNYDLPLIVHSRACEDIVVQILSDYNVKRVCLHCFGGALNLVKTCVENYNWYFSIPTSVLYNIHFQKLAQIVPLDLILTETDSPFLSPIKGTRNEPINILKSVQKIAELKNIDNAELIKIIFNNYYKLFNSS